MPKVNIEQRNPELYSKVKEQQAALMNMCSGAITIVRICPYCKHKIAEVVQGQHGYFMTKCDKCGEDVVFPPLSFRKA